MQNKNKYCEEERWVTTKAYLDELDKVIREDRANQGDHLRTRSSVIFPAVRFLFESSTLRIFEFIERSKKGKLKPSPSSKVQKNCSPEHKIWMPGFCKEGDHLSLRPSGHSSPRGRAKKKNPKRILVLLPRTDSNR